MGGVCLAVDFEESLCFSPEFYTVPLVGPVSPVRPRTLDFDSPIPSAAAVFVTPSRGRKRSRAQSPIDLVTPPRKRRRVSPVLVLDPEMDDLLFNCSPATPAFGLLCVSCVPATAVVCCAPFPLLCGNFPCLVCFLTFGIFDFFSTSTVQNRSKLFVGWFQTFLQLVCCLDFRNRVFPPRSSPSPISVLCV